jgi:hypothetical protein
MLLEFELQNQQIEAAHRKRGGILSQRRKFSFARSSRGMLRSKRSLSDSKPCESFSLLLFHDQSQIITQLFL